MILYSVFVSRVRDTVLNTEARDLSELKMNNGKLGHYNGD